MASAGASADQEASGNMASSESISFLQTMTRAVSKLKQDSTPFVQELVDKVLPQINDAESLYTQKEYRKCLDKYLSMIKHSMDIVRVQVWESRDDDTPVIRKMIDMLLTRAETIKPYCPQELDDPTELRRYKMIEAEMATDTPATFDNICGLQNTKDFLKERVVLPLRFPDLFRRPVRPVLLYGHPGTGKSLFIQAAAHEARVKLFVFNMYLVAAQHYKGTKSGENCMKTVFKVARNNKPCILCLEDLEVLSRQRDDEIYRKEKTELLIQLSLDKNEKVVVVGVTQRPWEVEPVVRRRFLKKCVDLPSTQARVDMVSHFLKDQTHNLSNDDLAEIGRRTTGYTGSDMCVLVREAAMIRLRQLAKAQFFKKILVPVEKCKASEETEVEEVDKSQRDEETTDEGACSCTAVDQDVDGVEVSKALLDNLNVEVHDNNIGTVCTSNDTITSSMCGIHKQGDAVKMVEMFVPCMQFDDGAFKSTVFNIPEKQLWLYPDVTRETMMEALEGKQRSVKDEEEAKMINFRQDYEEI